MSHFFLAEVSATLERLALELCKSNNPETIKASIDKISDYMQYFSRFSYIPEELRPVVSKTISTIALAKMYDVTRFELNFQLKSLSTTIMHIIEDKKEQQETKILTPEQFQKPSETDCREIEELIKIFGSGLIESICDFPVEAR